MDIASCVHLDTHSAAHAQPQTGINDVGPDLVQLFLLYYYYLMLLYSSSAVSLIGNQIERIANLPTGTQCTFHF